jgi:hypothetical protein
MVRFGIYTQEQYFRAGERRRQFGPRVSYSLLDIGHDPTEEQIRAFEDIGFTLRTSNGTFRTTFRERFRDVDEIAMKWLGKFHPPDANIAVQDRAVSTGITSWEWAERVFRTYPAALFEASDLLVMFIEVSLPTGEIFIVEPNGRPLQYIKPPFVVSLQHPERRRYPVNRWIAARARRRFDQLGFEQAWMTSAPPGVRVRTIPYVHPYVLQFGRQHPQFQFRERSVFDRTPAACDALRTMNILNRSYFSEEQLRDGVRAVFESLRPGGIWIVGRTLEEDFSNHAAFLRRTENGWELLERIGQGSEIEELALAA